MPFFKYSSSSLDFPSTFFLSFLSISYFLNWHRFLYYWMLLLSSHRTKPSISFSQETLNPTQPTLLICFFHSPFSLSSHCPIDPPPFSKIPHIYAPLPPCYKCKSDTMLCKLCNYMSLIVNIDIISNHGGN